MRKKHQDQFAELNRRIDGKVSTNRFNRYMLSTDGSIYQVEPAAVVYPKTTDDVLRVVEFSKVHGFTIHPRGAGSGLCGSALGKGIVIDFTRFMNRLISVNFEEKYFECEPGYRFGELEAVLKGKRLFFPPDPSSGEYATFGGMYGTNASGAHSVKYGNVADYIMDADVVFGTGKLLRLSDILSKVSTSLPNFLKELYSLYKANEGKIDTAYPEIRYNSTGYNLRELVRDDRLDLRKLLAGSEGTLGIVTRLKFRLIDKPPYDSLVVAFFEDMRRSVRAVQNILPLGPSGIEIMDKSLLAFAGQSSQKLGEKIPTGVDNVLLIEFDSFKPDDCRQLAEKTRQLLIAEQFARQAYVAVSEEEKGKYWTLRNAAVPTLYKLKGRKRILALIEDAAVPTDQLVEYVEGIYKILQHYEVDFVLYGHIAKGLLHTRPLLDLKASRDVALLQTLADEVFELVYSLGGAISGEHGDGRIRSVYIRRQYPDIYDLFLETKHLLDPENFFNPEIITSHDPDQLKSNLRYGPQYRRIDTAERRLEWPEGFENEVEKCHGCSKCTTVTVATRMCPIYKFTRDEAAAPKAKANLLRAMISGRVDEKDLLGRDFQHVINLCVNCGSCYRECPSNVNIPKMAIEARARFIGKYGPTVESRLLTNVELAGRTTRKFSRGIKLFLKSKVARQMMEKMTGISARREFIEFPFNSLFERIRARKGSERTKVLYFAGCYAGYIRPEIGESAIKVLGQLGMSVLTPDQHCCGLPMLSKGMVNQAREKIRKNINGWGSLIDSVEHIVVTCSSCGLSLMQEWLYLLDNEMIKRVRQKVIHISRLVAARSERISLKTDGMAVAYHYPCHLKIQPDPESSVRMLSQINGMTVIPIDTHCCGIAGSWGMSAMNYDLSAQIARDMIEGLSASGADFGVTDCPTCRIQMEHFSNIPIKHPIEIVCECLQ